MVLRLDLMLVMLALAVAVPAKAEEPVVAAPQGPAAQDATAAPSQPAAANQTSEPASTPASPQASTPSDPIAAALQKKISGLPAEGSDEEIKERSALTELYSARSFAPLWVTSKGLTEKGGRGGTRNQERRRLGTRSVGLHASRARRSKRERIRRAARHRGRRGAHAVAGRLEVRTLRARRAHHEAGRGS